MVYRPTPYFLLLQATMLGGYDSRRLPTAAARVQTRGLVMWDFVMGKSGAGAGFLRELRFPLPIYIPSASPRSSSVSPEADTIGQEWPQCQ
jgi:hypothetical protein